MMKTLKLEMLKMLKLDWSAMKYCHRRILMILCVLFVIGWFSTIYLVPMGAFLLFCFSLNPFAIEEIGDLNRLYLTLPIKRSSIVAGRYLLSLFMHLCGALLGMLLMPLANKIALSKWYPDFRWMLAILSFSFLVYALLVFCVYPMLFKFGYQRGKFWGVYLPIGVFGSLWALVMQYDEKKAEGKLVYHFLVYASEHMLQVSGGGFLLGLVLLTISFYISRWAYSQREF